MTVKYIQGGIRFWLWTIFHPKKTVILINSLFATNSQLETALERREKRKEAPELASWLWVPGSGYTSGGCYITPETLEAMRDE